jgi:nucleosome binding factor SPN SPT16 subunit
MSWNAVLQ